ncbi:MAG: hypothetical protein K2Y33_00100 [Mycolicibacterium frederiksbergense]|jgi:hypothetical protein|nr:hypothetical protein [Mycolicibacterium frederiksbergense]
MAADPLVRSAGRRRSATSRIPALLHKGDELFWLPLVGRPLDRHPVVGLGALDIAVTDMGAR